MNRYMVQASWWVEANDEEEAINKIENAVAAKVGDSELNDSEVIDEEPE